MRLIAVSQRVDQVVDRGEWRDALDQRLVDWLSAVGALAVPVPNSLDAPALNAWLARVAPDGVLLSGGNDIGQCPARDAVESRLLAWAAISGRPVLGICRGMQMMAVDAGAELVPVAGHVRSRHRLTGELQAEVNSYHEQAVAACPDGYRVLANSEDGCIEHMAHTSLPREAWMWHPERDRPFEAAWLERARRLFRIEVEQ